MRVEVTNMINKLKITTIGNSAGVIFTKDMLEKLRVQKGDTIFAIETKHGIELTAYDPEVARQMEVAEKVMRKHRDVLRKLAE
jgi:putative addiction module antidote